MKHLENYTGYNEIPELLKKYHDYAKKVNKNYDNL